MSLAQLIMPLISNIIAGIIENRLTRQNVNDNLRELESTLEYHGREKDGQIKALSDLAKSLEEKLVQYTEEFDKLANLKIDELVKKIQEKTPFYVDPIVQIIGDELKKGVDTMTDVGVDKIVEFVDSKAKELGISDNTESPDAKPEPEPVSKSDISEPEEKDYEMLSDNANEILKNLKKKHD